VSRTDDEATDVGRAAVYQPLADCQLLLGKGDDFLAADGDGVNIAARLELEGIAEPGGRE
jgi:hypothetical protein